MNDPLPCTVTAPPRDDFKQWIEVRREEIDELLLRHGAVLFRGFNVSTDARFQEAVARLSGHRLDYIYRSTPRTNVGEGVYTATEYPPGLTIPLHNENAYQRDWPMLLIFGCLQPSARGTGLTSLADTVAVTRRIDREVIRKFENKQVLYVRNYRRDIDLPWQVVFQSESQRGVEDYCARHKIAFEWTPDGGLRTRQRCQAISRHPRTGVPVWFNQAHLFHPSALDKKTQKLLRDTFKEEDFPRNVFYGDGSRIEEADLASIRNAFEMEQVTFQWEVGDVLLVDNMRVSHGRTPYSGNRRVLFAMCEAFSEAGCCAAGPDQAEQGGSAS